MADSSLRLLLTDMEIIAQQNKFQLAFNMYKATGHEFLDYDLPYPNTIQHLGGFVRLMWLINGYTGTKKSRDYLNDIIARFLISFAEYQPYRVPYKLKDIQNHTTHELKEFQALESIKRRSIDISRAESSRYTNDMVFWALKFYAEHLIIERGICQYELMLDYAINNFMDKKEFSTLKAKCKNICNWYAARDYRLDCTKKYEDLKTYWRETEMTRKEHMIKINKDRAKQAERLVKNAISGLMSIDYKKKNGEWNISKIAKELGLTRPTVMKYLN